MGSPDPWLPAPKLLPDGPRDDGVPVSGRLAGDAEIPGGWFSKGSPPEASFLFDNEKWAHDAFVAPARMARAPVTNGEFAAFIADGGYDRREHWGADGLVEETFAHGRRGLER